MPAIAAILALSAGAVEAKEAAPSRNIASGTQVGVGQCVSKMPAGRDIVTPVLTALVSKGVNLLGSAIDEAGKSKTWTALASRNLQPGSFPKCIQIVRGRFRTDAAGSEPSTWSALGLPAGAFDTLTANGIWIADVPDFFFEGAIVPSDDNSAATIRPLHAVMFKPQGERALRGDKERSVTVFLAFSLPGVKASLETNPAATVVIGPMKPGEAHKMPDFQNKQSSPYESPWFTITEADKKKPLTVTVMVSETQPGSPFFAFLSSIFNSDPVKKAITDNATVLVVPSAGAAAAAADEAAVNALITTARGKLVDAQSKLAICKKASSNLAGAGNDAINAVNAWLDADRKIPNPEAKIDAAAVATINILAPSTVPAACGALYTRITGEPVQ